MTLAVERDVKTPTLTLTLEELSHTKMKNCEYLGKAISSPLMLGGRYTPRQWSCFQKFLSPQKWWRF